MSGLCLQGSWVPVGQLGGLGHLVSGSLSRPFCLIPIVTQCADELQASGLICTLQSTLCGGGAGCCPRHGGVQDRCHCHCVPDVWLLTALWQGVGNGAAYWTSLCWFSLFLLGLPCPSSIHHITHSLRVLGRGVNHIVQWSPTLFAPRTDL